MKLLFRCKSGQCHGHLVLYSPICIAPCPRVNMSRRKRCHRSKKPNSTFIPICKLNNSVKRFFVSQGSLSIVRRFRTLKYAVRGNIPTAYILQISSIFRSPLWIQQVKYHIRFLSISLPLSFTSPPHLTSKQFNSPQASPYYKVHSPNLHGPGHSFRGPNSCRERVAVCAQQPTVVSRARVRPRKHDEFPISGLVWPVARIACLAQRRKPNQRMGRRPGIRWRQQGRIQVVLFRLWLPSSLQPPNVVLGSTCARVG